MAAPEQSFSAYLRDEIISAGTRHEQAVDHLLALVAGDHAPNQGRELGKETEAVRHTLRVYIGTLRRMANFSAQH